MTVKIASFWDDFADLLFPRVCAACNGVLAGSEHHICTECLLSLPRVNSEGLVATELHAKFAAFVEVKSVNSFLHYQPKGRVQALLRRLKYYGNRDLGLFIGRLCASERVAAGAIVPADLLVPVPLHARKLKERGYNQSEAFSRGLSEGLLIPLDESLLQRNTYTMSQTGKTKAERIAGMQGIFSVRPGACLRRTRVLLADDVLTTGATLEACIEALIANGCREIHIITIAAAQ